MAVYTLVKFKDMTPLHVGTGRENYDFSSLEVQSDTLSAALSALKVQISGGEGVESFMESVVLSSAFPYIDDCYFLPKPFGRINIEVVDIDEYIVRKKLKKLRFVEFGLWKKLIAGEKLTVKSWQLRGEFLLPDSFQEAKFDYPYKSQVNQRIVVPREDGRDAEPFFFEWTYFNIRAGLYCLLDIPQNMRDEVIKLFELLGENGLGTDRNIGGGKFNIEIGEISIPDIKDADSTMLLSLYIPTEEELKELNLEDSRYDLLLRGGFMSGSQEYDFRHLWKKSVYMFNTGSVFLTTIPMIGRVVNLKPDWNDERMHPVFRSGKPFVVRIKQ